MVQRHKYPDRFTLCVRNYIRTHKWGRPKNKGKGHTFCNEQSV